MRRIHRRTLFSRLFFNNLMVSLLVLTTLSTALLTMLQTSDYGRELNNVQNAARDLARIQQMVNAGYAGGMVFEDTCDTWLRRGMVEIWYVNRRTNSGWRKSNTAQEESQITQDDVLSLLEKIYDGNEVVQRGTFNARFTEDTLTVGVPIMDTRFNVVVGAVFVHTRFGRFTASFALLMRQIVITAMFAFLMSAMLTYYMTRRITDPLLAMSRAADNYSKGDFTVRLEYGHRDEIGRLALSMNSMAADLERMEYMRSGFVANVSHELRSPLTSLQGYLQAMLDNTIPPEEQPKYLGILLDETKRMTVLVNDLLDLSKLESGAAPLKPASMDINEAIRRVLIRFDRRIEEKELTIEAVFRTEQLMISADADRIDQVITNLIDNAVKYTDPGDTIKIWSQKTDDEAYITIEDNGPGIGADDLPYIFDRFYKVEKAHTSGLGTGLGLSIAKNIIAQHGGSIQASSAEGRGTTFVIKLPLAKTGVPA